METNRTGATRAAIERVWRTEAARLVGGLVRVLRDVDQAEELAQEALVAALETWPSQGLPDNPGAWLMATAKNRAVDQVRRRQMTQQKHAALGEVSAAEPAVMPGFETALDDQVNDDLLRLMVISCHPVLSLEARVALTLRLLGGLTTEEIARAFLAPEATIAQRIVRAKRTLAEARVPFEVPRGAELGARLPSVLEVVYLIFNEGYSATSGDDVLRLELCADALRLGRLLARLVPAEAEVHGLLALMELHTSRAAARVDARGAPVLLADQDRSRWDARAIAAGMGSLERAEALAQPLGPYALQAAIVACHARAPSAERTNWEKIVALYDALAEVTRSPVVELNRAVAVGMAFGAQAGLEIVDELREEPSLRSYHLLGSVRGELLVKLGRLDEARGEFERAALLAQNQRERELLEARARGCAMTKAESN